MNFFQNFNLSFQHSIFSSYMDWFHSFNCSLLLGILMFVTLSMYFLCFSNFFFKMKNIEYQMGELICSLFPVLILLVQMVPSLSLLFYYGLMNLNTSIFSCSRGYESEFKNKPSRLLFSEDPDFFYNLSSFKYLVMKLKKLGRLEMFECLLKSGKLELWTYSNMKSPSLYFRVDFDGNLRLSEVNFLHWFLSFLFVSCPTLGLKSGNAKFNIFFFDCLLPKNLNYFWDLVLSPNYKNHCFSVSSNFNFKKLEFLANFELFTGFLINYPKYSDKSVVCRLYSDNFSLAN